MVKQLRRQGRWWSGILVVLLLVAGCVAPAAPSNAPVEEHAEEHAQEHVEEHVEADTLPTLASVDLADGRALRVVASTNLVGDAVARVGGEQIELTVLLAPGVDPHAYQLAPADRQVLDDADAIFINGLGLEEGMLPVLEELAGRVPVVPVSAGIATLELGEHDHEKDHADEHEHEEDHEAEEGDHADEHADAGEEHHHEGGDPHSWQSVPNVIVWTANIAASLAALDPAQAEAYTTAAAAYTTELASLNTELHALVDALPTEQRKMVTDHDSLGYFAHEYGFTVLGTVIPSLSTVATASAQELAALQDQINAEGVKAIFVGTTVNPQVATQVAADLGIQVVPIYTDSLSETDGPASTYVDFMRHNMQTIVDALR